MIQINLNKMGATKKQIDYVKILSDYDFSKEDDEKDIQQFLIARKRNDIKQLTKKGASDLIQLLLERPTGFTLPCDTIIVLDKREVNSFHVLGDIEACLHYCPDNVYIGDCKKYENYQASLFEVDEETHEPPYSIITEDTKIIYIQQEQKKPKTGRQLFEIKLDDFIISDLRRISVSGLECSPELAQHYFLYWIKQKYDINEFKVYIENNQCHLEKKRMKPFIFYC